MNRGANALTFFVALLIVALLIGGFGYWLGVHKGVPNVSFSSQLSPTPSPTFTPMPSSAISSTPSATIAPSFTPTPTLPADPHSVVSTFLSDFSKAAASKSANGSSITTAQGYLTPQAQQIVAQSSPKSLLAGTAKFLGIDGTPDNVQIGNATLNGSTASVPTTWSFISGNINKTFYLVSSSSIWKIDNVITQ